MTTAPMTARKTQRRHRRLAGALLGLALPLTALAAPAAARAEEAPVACRNEIYQGRSFTLCEVDVTRADLRLFLYDAGGAPYGEFTALQARLAGEGKQLLFGMNAGMYHEDRSPVGHYVENGKELMRVIPNAGPGNFGMLPNGVLCINENRVEVIETLAFQDRPAGSCRDATQSGPMLVQNGELHPRIMPDGTSRYVRNGVGTSADGSRAVFVISNEVVTFYEFASVFRDLLKLPNALYFDGNVSRIYAPELNRNDLGRKMGPIVAVTAPAS
ncbi:phosphodiester glycosidase family protein [Pseudooceanicola sp. 502str34]